MIPELGQTYLSFASFIILLGVVQGILLSVTGLAQKQLTARMKGLIFICFTLILTEIFLNRTGYMYYVIRLVDFSEPVQFAVPPLIYFGVLSLDPSARIRKWKLHFIPFILYFLYFIPYYLAPVTYKQESYYSIHHLNDLRSLSDYDFYFKWGKLRMFQMQAFYLQSTVYLILSFQQLFRLKTRSGSHPFPDAAEKRWWMVFSILISLLIIVVVAVKILFIKDLGDHIIAFFITLTLYLSTVAELVKPSLTKIDFRDDKQQTASAGISEEKKLEITQRLSENMQQNKLYKDPLISLPKLAKQIGEPAYIVSRVINEKFGSSFYDWLAGYRVEEAKRLLTDPSAKQYTIEQIAEEVGYNSKSAFNKAFKKFTGKTPSEYRQF